MQFPTSYWVSLAFLIFTAMLCRRWPLLSLYGALGAFCAVAQGNLRLLPSMPEIEVADSILFALPSIVLIRACGMSDAFSILPLFLVPICGTIGVVFGHDAYSVAIIVGIGGVQGYAAVKGAFIEYRKVDRTLSRWAAVCIAAIGPLGLGFSEVWSDVAWTSVAAHAFACMAYLVHEERKQGSTLSLASENGRSPSSEPGPCTKEIK